MLSSRWINNFLISNFESFNKKTVFVDIWPQNILALKLTSILNLEYRTEEILSFQKTTIFFIFNCLSRFYNILAFVTCSLKKKNSFFLSLAVLGLGCCAQASSSCGEWGPLPSYGAWASHYSGFSCTVQALGRMSAVAVAPQLQGKGSRVARA